MFSLFEKLIKSNIMKHIKSDHNNACDKCDFKTSNKMHLKMHIKSCHSKNETNN